jgi:altronate dehydratase small subunit
LYEPAKRTIAADSESARAMLGSVSWAFGGTSSREVCNMGIKLIRIRPDDNVAVAVETIDQGELVRLATGEEVRVQSAIKYGYKVALKAIGVGEPIVKYGECIGHASKDIAVGDAVHVHNVEPLAIPDVYVSIT